VVLRVRCGDFNGHGARIVPFTFGDDDVAS
jgi:hypothetical protein